MSLVSYLITVPLHHGIDGLFHQISTWNIGVQYNDSVHLRKLFLADLWNQGNLCSKGVTPQLRTSYLLE